MRLLLLFLILFVEIFAISSTFSPVLNLEYDTKKAELGKRLFFDVRLSPSGTISCENCHNLYWNLTGTNPKNAKISLAQTLNTPTILNAAMNFLFFKDGSVRDINSQVKRSLTNINELGSSEDVVLQRVNSNPQYRIKFKSIYEDGVTFENIVDAIVHFQRALITPNSKFDKFISGDESVFSHDERRGFELFNKLGCANCHNGVNLGANSYYDLKIDENALIGAGDLARYKVPGLRNVAKTAPYLCNGKQDDLKEAIRHIAKLRISYDISDEQVELIYKFLLTLNGEKPEILK